MAALAWRLFLQPTRVSLSTITSPSSLSRSRILSGEKFEPLNRWLKGFEPALKNHAKSSHWKMYIPRCYANNFSRSGLKFGWGSLFAVSVVFGSIYIGPHISYAMDGFGIVEDDHRIESPSTTDEEDAQNVLVLARKLLPPAFLCVTVLMNWGHPIILVAKVILILFGTKPSPFSVYLFIDQLRQQFIQQQPFLYKFKSLYAKKVEVQDYKFLCVARVELKDQEFTLIGILGNWWVLPWPTSQEAFSIRRNKFLPNYMRN